MLSSPIRKADLTKMYEAAISFVRQEVHNANVSGLVLGLSGGLDSSVALEVAVKAVGSSHVLGLVMPETGLTPDADVADALEWARRQRIATRYFELTSLLQPFLRMLPEDRLCQGNLKARLRMALLYYFSNLENRLVVGTGDRSEILLGYFTKYGDGGADMLPLGRFYKTELKVLAPELGVPPSICAKPSSPRLWRDQTAEGELGISYEVADRILVLLEDEGLPPAVVKERLGLSKEVDSVALRVAVSRHKREMPHICPEI